MFQDAREQRAVFFRGHIARGVRDIDDRRARFDDGFNDPVQVLGVGPPAVFGEVFDVRAAERPGVLDGGDTDFQGLVAGHFELVLQVAFADAEARMDARALRAFQGIPGDINVLRNARGSGRRPSTPSPISGRDAADGLEVAGAGNGEARLDDIHAKPVQLPGDLHFLVNIERCPRRLLAVPQGGIKDLDSVVFMAYLQNAG